MAAGLLCGQATGLAKSRWLTELLDAAGLKAEAVHETVAMLNDAELGFEPAVSPEDTSLVERSENLIDFCTGFNYGLGLSSAGKKTTSLPKDTREVISDFQAIENLDLDELDDSDENAWQELFEFIRVGVLLVHEELQPVAGGNNTQVH